MTTTEQKTKLLLNYLINYDRKCPLRHKEVKLLAFLLVQSSAVTVREIARENLVDPASIGKYLSKLVTAGCVKKHPELFPRGYSITEDGIKFLDGLLHDAI